MRDADFYRRFEDRFRGSRESIKSRLRVYLDFVAPLKEADADCRMIDLGCGRGEWLELMREAGIRAHGVDTDAAMVAQCRELGLSAEVGDALSALRALPDESQAVVSAIHVAEHLAFDVLWQLVGAAHRVLKPDGLLILETPNPENIRVGTSLFYIDPTHRRPIPPELLSYLPEYQGFGQVKVMRLQELPHIAQDREPGLHDVLAGVSPDYAVVARKSARPEGGLPSAAFDRDYGLTLETLTARYDAAADTRARRCEDRLRGLEARLDAWAERVERAEAAAAAATAAAAKSRAASGGPPDDDAGERQVPKVADRAPPAGTASAGGGVTTRRVAGALSALRAGLVRAARAVLAHAVRFVLARDRLRRVLLGVIQRIPPLEAWLRRLFDTASGARDAPPVVSPDLAALTPGARWVYGNLRQAVEKAGRQSVTHRH